MTCVDCKQNLASGHLVFDYYDKRQQLVKHWNFKYKLGLVKWPRRSGVGARLCMRIPKHDMRRTDVTRCALYSRHSDFLLRDVADNESPTIGNGLFSHLPYIKGDVIAQFFGVIMSREDYDEEAAGEGGIVFSSPAVACYNAMTRALMGTALPAWPTQHVTASTSLQINKQ